VSEAVAGALIAAAAGLVGVAVGGYWAAHNQRRERQQRRISEQLAEFYGPMLGLRAQVLARSELRLKISGAADVAWRLLVAGARQAGIEHVKEVSEGRFHPLRASVTAFSFQG